ncbi:MAG: S41 family peptidase [Planctomycetota bacterium]
MNPLPLCSLLLTGLLAHLPQEQSSAPGELFDRVVSTLESRFYDKGFRTSVLPQLALKYRPFALQAGGLNQERQVIHDLLARIPTSHLGLHSQATYRDLLDELANRPHPTFGVVLVERNEAYYVASVLEGGSAAMAGLLRGDRVLEVDEVPVEWSPRLDWRGDDAALPDPPEHFLVCRDEGDAVSLLVERTPGVRMGLRLEGAEYCAFEASQAGARVIEQGGRRFGYVHFWYIPFAGTTRLLTRLAREDFRNCDGLILDLRGHGGSAGAVFLLVSALSGDNPVWTRPFVALIDRGTRSAKEVLAYELKKNHAGILVGEKTAGAVIPATFQEVGSDTVLMFPSFTLGRFTKILEGQGVEPDVEASDSLPFAAGADPILYRGVEVLLDAVSGPAGKRRS